MRPILNACASYVPSMETKSSRTSSSHYRKQSNTTSFRMRPYRASKRLTDLDDHDPFVENEPQVSTSVARNNSSSRDGDVEAARGDGGISITTKIEQEVNSRGGR